jgi:pyruvate formate lyase activating enzyme
VTLPAAVPLGHAAPCGAPALQLGGVQAFSSVDCPGGLAAVVFVQGCPWRCGYCHNPHLQAKRAGAHAPRWDAVLAWLGRRQGLLDTVVFSGGEPTMDPALGAAAAQVRALGFKVALHTAGLAPRRLQAVLPLLDWVGLDIKAPLADDVLHQRITGVRGGAAAVRASLALLCASGTAFECRTTFDATVLNDAAITAIAQELAAAGVRHYAVQGRRDSAGPRDPGDRAGPRLAAATLRSVLACMPHLELRGLAVG